MATLVLLNNFLHDFSAAGWIFCSVLLFVMLRSLPEGFHARKGDDLYLYIVNSFNKIRLFMMLSLAGIVVFGIFRALAYKSYEWNAASGDSQITLLIVKHILLSFVFAAGLYYYFRAGKMMKINE